MNVGGGRLRPRQAGSTSSCMRSINCSVERSASPSTCSAVIASTESIWSRLARRFERACSAMNRRMAVTECIMPATCPARSRTVHSVQSVCCCQSVGDSARNASTRRRYSTRPSSIALGRSIATSALTSMAWSVIPSLLRLNRPAVVAAVAMRADHPKPATSALAMMRSGITRTTISGGTALRRP